MMKNYEVTIGIPVYNVEKYIRLAMDSALAQTFENIEFLVLDDCGTDGSMDIVREYQQTHPRYTNREIRDVMWHPMSLMEILHSTGKRTKNLGAYIVSKLPPVIAVYGIRIAIDVLFRHYKSEK